MGGDFGGWVAPQHGQRGKALARWRAMRRCGEAIDHGLWRAVRTGRLGGSRGEKASLAHEEAVSRQTQRDVMVQPAPAAAFEMLQADLLLELAVILLDAGAPQGMADQLAQRRLGRQSDQPKAPPLARGGLLDQQPLLRAEPVGRLA